MAAVSALVVGALVAQDPPAESLAIRLETIRVDVGAYRPGVGLRGAIPTSAWRALLGERAFLLFDLDGDRALTPGGADGLAIEGLPFVVALPHVLLLEEGQFEIAFPHGTREAALRRQDDPVVPGLLREAALLTELRIACGLPPLCLSARFSRAASLHCAYLDVNGLTREAAGPHLHREDAALPGYTPDGAEAGAQGNLFLGCPTFSEAVRNWHASAFHRAPMVDSRVRTVGVAHERGVSVLYFCGVEARHLEVSLPHPPDGAVGVPCAFAWRGEMPNPVPGTPFGAGCGFPVLLLLAEARRGAALREAVLEDGAGNRVAGTASCPRSPANPEWPSNSNCAMFVPSAPLVPRTLNRARFVFVEGHPPVEWTFTTGGV